MTAFVAPFVEFAAAIEKSARNGTRAHIPPEISRALIESPAYAAIVNERTKELVASWEGRLQQPPVSSSDHSGSGIAPSATNGASVGTMTAENQESVGRAASRRASAAIAMVAPRKRRRMP